MNNATKTFFCVVLASLSVSTGCRYDRDLLKSAVEKERQTFVAQYKAERDKILNREYSTDTGGMAERCFDLLSLTTNTYNKVLRWHLNQVQTEAEKSRIDAIKRYCDLWISKVDKEYENATGSYSGIFHADEWMIFYNKAICRLLMSQGEAERWRRVENLTWELHGKRIDFSNGETHVKLPWRLFEPNPYFKAKDWAALIDEESVFSSNGADYAIVWFAGAGNLVSDPTTTEERVLVEIKGGKVLRYVGLHNILNPEVTFLKDRNQLMIRATTGYFSKVKFVVDLQKMKIIRQLSLLPLKFDVDGYGKIFTIETINE